MDNKLESLARIAIVIAFVALSVLVIWPSARLLLWASETGLDKFKAAYTLVVKDSLLSLADKLLVAAIAWITGTKAVEAIYAYQGRKSDGSKFK